jgi:K+-transporting ATPase KdpF subunit
MIEAMVDHWLYWIAGGLAIALAAYLFAVLFRPEKYL